MPSVTSSWRYRAYGETAQYSGPAAPSILGYAGQLLDPSGLHCMRARWYDAGNARFISRDPASLDSSGASSSGFSYAVANPVAFFDPAGLSADAFDPGGIDCTSCFGATKRDIDVKRCGTDLACSVVTNPTALTRGTPAPDASVCLAATSLPCSLSPFREWRELTEPGGAGGAGGRVEQLRKIWNNRSWFLNWLRGNVSKTRLLNLLSQREAELIVENAGQLGLDVDLNAAGVEGLEERGSWKGIPHFKVENVHIPIAPGVQP